MSIKLASWSIVGHFVTLIACTGTSVLHEQVPQRRAIEYLSISEIKVAYPAGLSQEQETLIAKYRPGERVAEKVRDWAEETGMWGGDQSLVLHVHSIRLPARWKAEPYGPIIIGSAVAYRGEDHLGIDVEIREGERVLHRMDVTRTLGRVDRSLAEVISSDRAMHDLIADVAWQIVYEMTPPGYDEAIIRAGHRDGVQPATLAAARRGLLSYGEILKASATDRFRGSDYDDLWCGVALSKPFWIPWWVWDPFSYKKCKARAVEAETHR